jgi:hypothetical protein
MPRLARLDAPRTLHHVIVRGNEMRRIVDDRRDREAWVSRMWEEMGLPLQLRRDEFVGLRRRGSWGCALPPCGTPSAV